MVHYGKFDYESIYTMPVQFRMFYLRKLINVKQKEIDSDNAAQGKQSGASPEQNVRKGPAINR
jgi:hypothetical protein